MLMIRLALLACISFALLLFAGSTQKLISLNVALPSLERSSKSSNISSQNLKIQGQFEFEEQITIPLRNADLNEINIVLGRLITQNNYGSWQRQQSCKFVPKHMEIDMENQDALEIRFSSDQKIKNIAHNEENRYYFLTEKYDTYIYELKARKDLQQKQDSDAKLNKKSVQNVFQLKKVEKLSFINHKIDHIIYSKEYEQLFGYNKHQIWIIYTNEAGNRVNFQSLLQFDKQNEDSIKKVFFYKGVVFLINGNNHLLVYQVIDRDDSAIHLELAKQINYFGKTINIEVVDLTYKDGKLWVLDYEYGIYEYKIVFQQPGDTNLNENSSYISNNIRVEEKQSYRIKYGYKLGIYHLSNGVFQIIFEFKKKQYILELWLNQDNGEMLINRFYHQINQPQGILKIDDNYMSVVGKKVVSMVRYGVNAGLWGKSKWVKLQSDSMLRNLQIRQESSQIDQQLEYYNFANTNNQLYTSFTTKNLELTSFKQTKTNQQHQFLVGFTANKVFFRRLIKHQPKIVCSFSGEDLRQKLSLEEQSKLIQFQQTLTLQYITPFIVQGQRSPENKQNNILNYFQSASSSKIQLDITLIDPQLKKAQLFYFYLKIGIYILAGLFTALILTLCCVMNTRKKKRSSLQKLNESLDRQMKGIQLGSHKKSVLQDDKKQQQMKSSESVN